MRALLLVLVGCGSNAAPPEPTPGPAPAPVVVTDVKPVACEATITAAAKRIATESKRLELLTSIERTSSVMISSCEADHWPADVMTCIASARLDPDLESCTEELTYRQHKRLHDKIAAVTPPPKPEPKVAVVRRPPPKRDELIPLPTATAKLDCSKTVLEPLNRACVKQFCTAHADDIRCMID